MRASPTGPRATPASATVHDRCLGATSRYGARVNVNHQLIERFYTAFHAKDAATMAASYADTATFSDPVFPDLDAAGVRAMWTMLCGRAPDLTVQASNIVVDGDEGRAHWVARYTFSATKRFVENQIDARFTFKDGRIVRHVDTFDFWRWSRQALGAPGALLGWTPMIKSKVRAQAAEGLRRYREKAG